MENETPFIISLFQGPSGWKWLILGVTLLVLELFTGSLFLLWPAIAAIIVGVLVFILPIGWELQLVLFGIISIIGLIWGQKYLRPRLGTDDPTDLNDRASLMVGKRVKAVTDFELGRGRVKIGDTEWAASIHDGNPKAGDELRILSVGGASVTVEAI